MDHCIVSSVLGAARTADGGGRGQAVQAGMSRRFGNDDEVLLLLQESWCQAGAEKRQLCLFKTQWPLTLVVHRPLGELQAAMELGRRTICL